MSGNIVPVECGVFWAPLCVPPASQPSTQLLSDCPTFYSESVRYSGKVIAAVRETPKGDGGESVE